ncbi:carboxymuconolactone decarboxylase family protein [Aquimarina agarilytica]|uniref:carboxymuconolactone decarboxylase family protein n=1 Tax=Aquimarina agarilytica TaxID=1087449 RepID=UPI000289ED71|nr:peroxidase-related enzyme [Aquimarina agarilytica]
MKNISSLIEDPELTPDLEKTYQEVKENLNAPFVPNFFKIWGHAPVALQGILPVMKHILGSGELDRKLKEMIMIAVSSGNECNYCQTAHHAFCTMLGGTQEQIDLLKAQQTLNGSGSPKEREAIDFAVRVAKSPNSTSEEDFKKLGALGYSTGEIMELIAMAGMAVFYNLIADASGVKLDKEFLEMSRNKEAHK